MRWCWRLQTRTGSDWTENDGSFKDHSFPGLVSSPSWRREPNDPVAPISWAVGWQVADVDGDGRDDLITRDSIILANAGPFGPLLAPNRQPPSAMTAANYANYVERGIPLPFPRYADLNGDGKPDIITIEPPPSAGSLSNQPGLRRNGIYLIELARIYSAARESELLSTNASRVRSGFKW